MVKPYYQDSHCTIYHGDCREILPQLEPVDLVLTDPPYCSVLDEQWDNMWKSDEEFLGWVKLVSMGITDVLKDNGSLYWFCSPQMHARVECEISKQMHILASIVWDKSGGRNGAGGSGVDVTSLRTYWTANTERVVFAEKYGSDLTALSLSGYESACIEAKGNIFGSYLKGEFKKACVSNKDIAKLFPSKTGRVTGCVSNWLLGLNQPTKEQYEKIREFLNKGKEYDFLRKEYEELRKEYEELRRPFFLDSSKQWGDVWKFDIERNRLHPAQKPIAMIKQIIAVSSRPNNTVLDICMGSGTTLRAAKDLNRKAIGIEIEEKYCEIAVERLRQEVLEL
jgi:site-specific DNA-methyltransferase (adenine-specific)